MNQNLVNGLQVDSNIDRHRDGSFSSILKSRDDTKSNVSQQAQNLHETTTAMGRLNAQMQEFIKSLEEANNEVKKSQAYKDFSKEFKNFTSQFNDARVIVNRGSTNIEQLAKNVEKSNNAFDSMSLAYDEMISSYNEETKTLKELSKAKKKQLEYDKADLRNRKELRSMQSKQIISDAKEGNKSALKAFQQGAGKLNQILSSIDIRGSLDKLVSATGRSDAANTQISMMSSYNLNKAEFNAFKRQLYKQIDTSLYNSRDVKEAIGSLQQIGLNTTEEMTSKFDLILRGQQLLGITAQQQAKLQTISNRTGRDFLTFTTNKLAKLMVENNNIGKKQLSELLDLNSNLVSQFADIGISTPEFEDASMSATAALTNLMGGDTGLAQKYTSIMTELAMNNNASGAKVGLGLDDYYAQLSNGTNLATMISRGNGSLGSLYNQLMSGSLSMGAMSELVNQGVLSSSERDLLTHMTNYDKQNGTGAFAAYLDSYKGTDGGKALDSVEENTAEGTSMLSKLTNNFTNWVASSFDWVDFSNFEQVMKVVTTLLGIIAASEAIQGLGSLLKGLWKGATGLGGKLAAGKLGSNGLGLISNTGAAGLSTAGKFVAGGSIAAGTLWAGIDAYNGFNQTSKEMYGENANTGQKIGAGAAAMVSGSKVHKTSKGKVDMGQNMGRGALSGAGKGALIGAGIGSFIPGVGTVVGGAIGAGVGAIAGLVGGWWKSRKAQEQEQRDKEKVKAEKEIAANTSRTNSLLGTNLSLATRKTASVRSYTGVGSPSAAPISHGNTGGMGANYPWPISSPFGPRTLGNGDSSFHNGVDWGVSEGTPIGAPVSGTITRLATDGRNTYYNSHGLSYQQRLNAGLGIYLAGSDGRTYQFWHLSKLGVKQGQSVKAGDTIGLSGNSGYSTGPHLHYGVQVNGAWVDPISNNLAPAALFSASGAKLVEVDVDGTDSSSSSSDSSDYAKASTPTQKVYQNKIRRFSTYAGAGMGAVVDGLADIKQTLIDLSNRQTQDEQILQMLQGSRKQEPRRA